MKSFLIAAGLITGFVAGCVSPAKKTLPAATRSERVAAIPPGFYVVAAGDTGMKIAMDHNLMIADLVAMNPDVEWAKLKVGQLVRIAK